MKELVHQLKLRLTTSLLRMLCHTTKAAPRFVAAEGILFPAFLKWRRFYSSPLQVILWTSLAKIKPNCTI